MMIQVTNSARSQLQSAIAALARRSGSHTTRFVRDAVALLANPAAIERAATPIAGFPGLPASEVVLHGVRLFFRTVDDTLWLIGAWRTQDRV